MDKDEKKRQDNPRQGASRLSIVTFAWLFKTFLTGFRRDLDLSDLYYPLDEHSSHNVGERISAEWKREQERYKSADENAFPNLTKVIARCFSRDLLLGGLIQALLEFIIRLSRPYILLQLLHCSSDKSDTAKMEAYAWATALVASIFIDCIASHMCVQNLMHTGMKIRIACSTLLYRKVLNVPITLKANETSVGQVLNLLSNDVSRIDHAVYYMHYIWIAPLQALLVFYLLYRQVGLSASSGIILQLLFIPILGLFGRLTNRLTSKYTARTDERLRLTNEIIKGIRAIKMYAWEKPFSALVDQVRRKEVQIIKRDSIMSDMSLASEFYIPRLCIFATVLAYVLLGNNINAEKVYVVTAFYDVLRMSMYTLFPMCLHDVAEALVSLQRLQKFMLIEQVPSCSSLPNDPQSQPPGQNASEPIIKLVNLSACWSDTANGTNSCSNGGQNKVLDNVSLSIARGSLTGVVGQVGSGKTSLLQVILGEVPGVRGELTVRGSVSYAGQEAWIFTSSVRQNIIFGGELERERYERVIEVCQLRRDLESFPLGDATLLGEKGINLSGGQCARLNLARAIYRDTDIYLLDDPLSAVDALVARDIFRQCVRGFLKGKTVVLVTHQLQYLKELDRVVLLNRGAVQADGTFEQLRALVLGEQLIQAAQLNLSSDANGDQEQRPEEVEESDSVETSANADEPTKSTSESDEAKEEGEDDRKVAERKIAGSISAATYGAYFLASRNMSLVVLVVTASLLHQLSSSGADYFLAYWVNEVEARGPRRNDTPTTLGTDARITASSTSEHWHIYFYGSITATTIILCLLQSWSFFEMSMRIANNLHASMFNSVICTAIEFFVANPLGRIMNRFSKDMSMVDTEVSRAMIDVIQNAIHLVAAFVVVSSVNYWLIIPAGLVGCCFYIFSLFFVKTSRSIKRLEALTRSPVFTHVSDSLQGLATIRALKAKEALIDEFDDHQDLHSSACFVFFSGSRGLGMYLDLFCSLYLGCVLLTLMGFDENALAGDIGLAITQCMLLINMLQWGVRQFAELENQMTSVERVLEYTTLQREVNGPDAQEDDGEMPDELSPLTKRTKDSSGGEGWPSAGRIEFRNVGLSYEAQGLAVLKDLNFVIEPGEKIGIVGRTGAGKSSLINALFRLAHVRGEIFIDGVETGSLSLTELRSKISIIPQEPILFTGSLRNNLDPFGDYSDEELWQVLEDVGMRRSVDVNRGLESRVAEGGANFSVGQRQLLCLARAILRNNKILVLDEATANVDPYTDDLIQKTVKKKFKDCTIMTVAHRLHTVIGSDRIIVMDSGVIVEFDHPYVLLTEKKGLLYGIVNKSGSGAANLLQTALKAKNQMILKNELANLSEEKEPCTKDTEANETKNSR